MTTPVRREGYVPVPRVPTDSLVQPTPEIHTSTDLGWVVSMAAGLGVVIASWTVFLLDAPDMWAGYWASLLGTIIVLADLGVRTSLPRVPLLAAIGLSGGVLLILGITQGWGTHATVSLVAAGAAAIVGAGMQSAARN